MAFGYEVHPKGAKKTGAPTPFHHPPRPMPERSRTAPMAIPNALAYQESPPPLPPPRSIDISKHDLGWHMANMERSKGGLPEKSTPVRAGSSLLGGSRTSSQPGKPFSIPERKIDLVHRQVRQVSPPPSYQSATTSTTRSLQPPPLPLAPTSLLTSRREEIVPASPPFPDLRQLMEYNKLQSEKNMSSDALRRSSQAYDQQLLSKIGASSGPQPTSSLEPPFDMENTLNKLNGQLLNIHGSSGAAPPSLGLRSSPLSDSLDRLSSFPHRASSVLAHTRPSTQFIQESSQLDRLQSPGMAELSIQDRNAREPLQESRTGQKRRAQSPPGVEPHSQSNDHQQESWQRNIMQLAGNRNNPTSRFNSGQFPGSISTVASSHAPNSYTSSSGFNPSQPGTAATSYSSDRFSPGAYQSTADAGASQAPTSVMQFHQGQANPPQPGQAMTPPVPQRKIINGILRAPGLWICDCCPKKPKKFDSEEELRIHEMEKQYICQYCHNRFKNKNEAERHQNSLHLRRHSWSCAALNTFEAAFHPTPINTLAAHIPGQERSPDAPNNTSQQFRGLHATATDTCGYCGQEFINPPSWEQRIEHLNQTHKFGECNQSKKFFRADHFRQHLKHSHAGTSGKWTNMLEQACMKDEPLPVPLAHGMPAIPNALPGGTPGIAMIGQQALLAAHQLQQQNRQAQEQAQQQAQQALGQQPLPGGHPNSVMSGVGTSTSNAQPVAHYVTSDPQAYAQQFESQMQQVQQYQPETHPDQQGLNLAQHLQQAQREMAANMTRQPEQRREDERHDTPGLQRQHSGLENKEHGNS